jgi:tetratricopeptide (TPR) repeat protein
MQRKELVLYSLAIMQESKTDEENYYKQNLANAMDISSRTLDQYFTDLAKDGYISKKNTKFKKPLNDLVSLTPMGLKELSLVDDMVSQFLLTPERHNIPSCISVDSILKRIRDPMEKIFFLSMFTRLKRFDLTLFMDTMKYNRSDSNLVKILSDVNSDKVNNDITTIADSLYRTYLFEDFDEKTFLDSADLHKDLDSILVLATAYHRQGRNNDARILYNIVLSEKARPNQNQWFLANFGLARVMRSEGDPEGSISLLDQLTESTDNTIFHAMINERKGMTYSEMGIPEEAEVYFSKAEHSLNNIGIPLLSGFVHNDRGIHYLRIGKLDLAAEDWRKCKKLAKEARSEMIEAVVLINLAFVEMVSGDLDQSEKNLSRSRKILSSRNDLEGLAANAFTSSLLCLYRKDIIGANENFARSETVAYPAPSPLERKERREIYLRKAKELGLEGAVVPDLSILSG